MMKKLILSLILSVGLLFNGAWAQQWEYGDFAADAPLKRVLVEDNYETAPQEALPHLQWLLQKTPKAHKNLYIYAASVYNKMVDLAEDPYDAVAYTDTVMMIYDKRIAYFGEEEKVIPYKAYYAFYYWGTRPDKAPDLYTLYQKALDIQGKGLPAILVEDYMRLVGLKRNASKPDVVEMVDEDTKLAMEYLSAGTALSDEDVINVYNRLQEIIDANINTDPEQDWASARSNIDDIFQASVKIDCDYVKKNFGAAFEKNPKSIPDAEKLVAQMLSAGCDIAQEPIFEKALGVLYDNEPTYSRCMSLAILAKARGDEAGYLKYVEQGIGLASSNSDKADAYMILAANSDMVSGRNYALKAADLGAGARAYNYIAGLYMNSYSVCAGDNPVLSRACFLAAYDMYAKAGNSTGMGNAQRQFPAGDEIFTYGMQVGQSVSVGCWIGGSTTLRKR